MMDSGSALGSNCGPLLIKSKGDLNPVDKDLIEASAWFQLAASSDYDQARLNSSIVEANLNNKEIQQAKERAEQYLSEYTSTEK